MQNMTKISISIPTTKDNCVEGVWLAQKAKYMILGTLYDLQL